VQTADPDEAHAALARGERVVLIVSAGGDGSGGSTAAATATTTAVPGRLALFVGDAADAAVWAGATEMGKELFM
jgi:hypothetical protein